MPLKSPSRGSGHSASGRTVTANMVQGGVLLCWGSGEFGQHSHGHNNDVNFRESQVKQFASPAALGVISQIACGASHCVAVTETGEVYVWGNGHSGQLGSGNQEPQLTPTALALSPPLPKGARVRSCACGSRHTMLLLDNGHVYSCGNNFYTQLGYSFRNKDYKENQVRPHLLEYLKHRVVRQVACGDKHSLFLFDQGAVAAVGNNAHGQLGDGSRDESGVPKTVELSETVISVTCGPNHNLVITDDGDVHAWGYGKACGKRRHDVLSPIPIIFKGKQVSKVAGGNTHSLALTAGGKVYAWGFGMDGQLGLGSVVMATRPKRLRHSFLDNGASSVACGESYSAVVTVSGRLYMFGRNSHTIEEGKGSLDKMAEPVCMNPEPEPAVRHVVCGAWHAAALTGQPDFVPLPEDRDSSDDDSASLGAYSTISSASTSQDDSAFDTEEPVPTHLPTLPVRGDLEVSAPPLAVRSAGGVQRTPLSLPPATGQPGSASMARTKTKMTIGEFYAMSDSKGSSSESAPPSVKSPAPRKENQPPPLSPSPPSFSGQAKPAPLVVEVPSADLDSSESDDEHLQLPGPTAQAAEASLGNAALTFTASAGHSRVEPLPLLGVGADGEASSSLSSFDSPAEWAQNVTEALEKSERKEKKEEEKGGGGDEEEASPRGRGGGGGVGSGTRRSELSQKSRGNYSVRTGGRTPAVGRERSLVVSRNMDILDASQLLAGGAGGSKDAGRMMMMMQHGGGGVGGGGADFHGLHFDSFPFTAGFYDFDDHDLLASPRHAAHRDTPMQHVPLHQLEGDFGPAQVKRSSSFFGALSGHVSRSPTKFFRKPTPTSHLHRTPVPASSHTPIPTSHAPTSRTSFTHQPTPSSAPRPGMRGLGLNVGAGGGTGGGGGAKSGGPQGRHGGQGQGQQGGQGTPPAKLPVFSSAASWRKRAPGVGDDLFDDLAGQSSPPNSSKQTGRKHVAFVDERSAAAATTSGARHAKPTLADAMAASPTALHHNSPFSAAYATAAGRTPVVGGAPVFQVEGHGGVVGQGHGGGHGGGVQPHGQGHGVAGGQTHGQDHGGGRGHVQGQGGSQAHGQSHSPTRHVEGQGGHQAHSGPVVPSLSITNSPHVSSNTAAGKQAPTLAYRILNGKTKKEATTTAAASSSSSKPLMPISPRTGANRTLVNGSKRSGLNSLPGQGRSRTQAVPAGSAERNRKAHFD